MSRHRVLIRVEGVAAGEVCGVIPSWRTDTVVVLPTDMVPLGVQPGDYLMSDMNLDAGNLGELRFGPMENIGPPPSPEEVGFD